MNQLFRAAIEKQIDSPNVNPEMICLSEKSAVRDLAWNVLMV
jgi:hypothetical protein